jgi:hypothetical protein
MLDAISTDLDDHIRTPYDPARAYYDTPFYDGNSRLEEQKNEDQIVCIEDKCSPQSAVNYVAQGMYAAASGQSLEDSNQLVQEWNFRLYKHDATSEELYWNQYGYNYYLNHHTEDN